MLHVKIAIGEIESVEREREREEEKGRGRQGQREIKRKKAL